MQQKYKPLNCLYKNMILSCPYIFILFRHIDNKNKALILIIKKNNLV